MRRQRTYTDAEILAFDDGYMVALEIVRQELIKNYDRFKTGSDLASVLHAVNDEAIGWIRAQQEQE